MNNITCSICKKDVDNGGWKNDKFVCHDCLSLIDKFELKITEQIKIRELS